MSTQITNGTAYVVDGKGPPVLLIHGMGLNHQMWAWQTPALTRRFQTIQYDLWGHGDSDKQPGAYTLLDFADQAVRLLDHLKLDRCALVGFSLGGMIGRAIAIAHPDRVSALAILNSPHDRTQEQRDAMIKRLDQAMNGGPAATVEAALRRWFTESFARTHPDILDQIRNWMNANDPETYAKIYRTLATGDAELVETIASIQCPVLTLACEEDHGNSPDMARRMAARMPNARAVIIPTLKHMGLVEDPAAISAALVPFLEEALG